MADPLDSARIKLQRANLHAGVARREARRFLDRQTDPEIGIEPYGECPTRPGDVYGYRVVIKRGWPDLPDSFAARFGDAVHNYRSALDHIAWQLVGHGERPPSTLDDSDQSRVQFPIYDAEDSFDKRITGRLPGVSKDPCAFIKSRHEYVGGEATNKTLLSLAKLSNDDKHRTLTVVATALQQVEGNMTLDDCALARPTPLARFVAAAVKDDEELARFDVRLTGPNPHVKMRLQPTFHIALEGGEGFGDVLAAIEAEVTKILNAPEIRAAVG